MSKNYKGGYQIVSLNSLDLTEQDLAVAGIYARLEGNYKKPILLEDIVIDGVEKEAEFVTATVSDSAYVIKASYGTIKVYADDTIDVTLVGVIKELTVTEDETFVDIQEGEVYSYSGTYTINLPNLPVIINDDMITTHGDCFSALCINEYPDSQSYLAMNEGKTCVIARSGNVIFISRPLEI